MGIIKRLFGDKTAEKKAHVLYVTIANHSRQPAFFTDGQVADTLDGRFDVVALHMSLILMRLNEETVERERARDLGQFVQEVMFANLDQSLREIGVGDLGVGKKVKKMAEALYGRQNVYTAALSQEGQARIDALKEGLLRNLYRGADVPDAIVENVAKYMLAQKQHLDQLPFNDFWQGTPSLLAFEPR